MVEVTKLRALILAFGSWLLASSSAAGVVQGTIQEAASGYALSRTVVRLVPVPRADNIDLKQMQLRTGTAGQFVFFNVPDGYYFLISTREGYFPGAWGQRRPNGQGTPILVTRESDLFAQLRMHRKGAITGRVLDENNVGIEGVPVVAYRAHLPLRVVAQGVSDDRGVYRIKGLDTGRYWIRTTPHTLDDGSGVLPTFGPQSREVREARAYDVHLDDDTPDADVHAEFGRLFNISGDLQCLAGRVKVTLTSETVRRITEAPCGEKYQFVELPPALYEVTAENQSNPESGFIEQYIDKATSNASVKLNPPPVVTFDVRRIGSGSAIAAPLPSLAAVRIYSIPELSRRLICPKRRYWQVIGNSAGRLLRIPTSNPSATTIRPAASSSPIDRWSGSKCFWTLVRKDTFKLRWPTKPRK